MSSKSSSGDWTCISDDCRNLNYARRTHCNRCGEERPSESSRNKRLGTEIGRQAAEASRGLFSEKDWQCSKCGNVNWARRSTCNICNAPKFTDLEERTGYGGGYNDRGVVEYKEREDSDSEFDEFGRRKKKRLNNGNSAPDESQKTESSGEAESEEEEEEDTGDEDISKYKLFDDDEIEEAPKDLKEEEKKSPPAKNGRSKSKESSSSSSSSSSSGSSSTSSRSRSRDRRRRSHSRSKSRSRRRSHSRSRSSRRSRSRSRHRR